MGLTVEDTDGRRGIRWLKVKSPLMARPKDFLAFCELFYGFSGRGRSKALTQIKILTFSAADEADGQPSSLSRRFFFIHLFVVSRPSALALPRPRSILLSLLFSELSPFRTPPLFFPGPTKWPVFWDCALSGASCPLEDLSFAVIWDWRGDDGCVGGGDWLFPTFWEISRRTGDI